MDVHRRRLLPRRIAPNPSERLNTNKVGPFWGVGGNPPTRTKRRLAAPLIQTSETKRTKKFPSFPLSNKETLAKVEMITGLVETCLFAFPFLATKRTEEKDFDSDKPRNIDEIKEKLKKEAYMTTNEIFDDMEEVFNSGNDRNMEEISFALDNDRIQRRACINADERERMGNEMKKKLLHWTETNFVDEMMEERPVAGKIFTALQKRFPHVPEEELKVKAYEVAHSKEDIWKKIVRELNQKNENERPDAVYQKFHFAPSRHLELDEEHAIHKFIAGYQFYRMMMKWAEPGASFPIPLRKVENPHDAIAGIDYIRNPQIEEGYEAQKRRFEIEGKQVAEALLFHGTAVASVDSILKNNFSLDHSPIQQQESSRDKRRMFGEGIYFSEMPAVSLMYGNGLLLCKVILGECETFTPRPGTVQPDIPDQFDSREVKTRDGSGVIHVVKRPVQVLPYCIIQLKNEALSSDYRKPTMSPLPATVSLPPLDLNTVTADPEKSTSKEEQVQATLDSFTIARKNPNHLTQKKALQRRSRCRQLWTVSPS